MVIYISIPFIAVIYIFSILYPLEYEIIFNIIEEKLYTLKEKLTTQMIFLGYNILYYYSITQININKCTNKITNKFIKPYISILWISVINFLKAHKIIIEPKLNIYCIYKDGTIVNEIKTNEISVDKLLNMFGETINKNNYDFIIFSDRKEEYEQINKIHYTKFPEIINDYKNSNIKFFSVELEYKGEKYSIELKNEKNNHYVVNNVLNKEFFKYYLKNVLNVEIDNNNFDYKVLVIDHNVNLLELNPSDFLVIKEDDYEVNSNIQTNVNPNNANELNETTSADETDETEYGINEDSDYIKLN